MAPFRLAAMTMRARQTTPGSIAHAIAESVTDACLGAGRGLTVPEHAEAYRARHGEAPTTYSAQFFSLVRRGILVAVGGRASRTLYAHRDSTIAADPSGPEADPDDDAPVVLAALRRAVEVAGCPVSTVEVGAWIARLGLRLRSRDINAVRVRLKTLARRRKRGVSDWAEPRVRTLQVETVGGREMRLWEPIEHASDHAAAVPARPLTAADAVRELVLHVQALLGRPAFRRELAWWLESHRDHPVALHTREYLTGGRQTLAQLLVATSAWDEKRQGPGRLQRVALPFTCWGGAASRYWVGEIPAGALLAAVAEEVANGLRAADELAALGVLARRVARVRVNAVQRLLAARRGALAGYLRQHLGEDRAAVQEAMETLVASYALCRAWAAAGARTEDGRYSRLRDLEERERHVRALPACAAEPRGKTAGRCVGTASVVTLDQLEPFLAAAAKELQIEPRGARRVCLVGVRRIPLTPAGTSSFGAHPDRADVGYDRVDALLAIYRLAPAARTRALLDLAAELLGPVLRDPALLAAIAAAPSATPGLRRAAVVALGLLGFAPGSGDVARLQTEDTLDGRAVLLARTLAGEALGDLELRDAALTVAARRIANGRLLTALG